MKLGVTFCWNKCICHVTFLCSADLSLYWIKAFRILPTMLRTVCCGSKKGIWKESFACLCYHQQDFKSHIRKAACIWSYDLWTVHIWPVNHRHFVPPLALLYFMDLFIYLFCCWFINVCIIILSLKANMTRVKEKINNKSPGLMFHIHTFVVAPDLWPYRQYNINYLIASNLE